MGPFNPPPVRPRTIVDGFFKTSRIHLFIHSFIHSFIYSFTHSLIKQLAFIQSRLTGIAFNSAIDLAITQTILGFIVLNVEFLCYHPVDYWE